MIGPNGSILTQHSLNPVPFVVAGRDFEGKTDVIAKGEFGLADIAPTILALLGISQPKEMTGRSMISTPPLA